MSSYLTLLYFQVTKLVYYKHLTNLRSQTSLTSLQQRRVKGIQQRWIKLYLVAIFSHVLKCGLIYQSTKHYQLLLSSGWFVHALVYLKKQANFILLINWGQACSFKRRSWMTSFNSGLHQFYSSLPPWKPRQLYHSEEAGAGAKTQPTFLTCKLDFILHFK